MPNLENKGNNLPVVIIGGSLVGLSAAALLAWHDIPVILVEKHKSSSLHPRAVGYTARTIEIYRGLGLEDQLPLNQRHFQLRRAKVESLVGPLIEETDWTPGANKHTAFTETDFSPVKAIAIAQDGLEPILREKARQLGADLRLGTEMLGFSQDADGVTVLVKNRDTGKESTIHALYMIAADGSDSPVREMLGITRQGRGLMNVVRSVLFRAPLDQYLESGISQFEIDRPDLKAFLTTYRDGRWVLMFTDDVDRNEEETLTAIKQAIGRDDLPIEIITKGRWKLSALITNQFTQDRIFLAGDAAHTLPPTRGGFGANTGIHDVHNLAWKLAAVIKGISSADLLDTYHQERWPVAWNRYQQTFIRPDYASYANKSELEGVQILDDIGMELGQLYRSDGIIGTDDSIPAVKRPDQWGGQPGTRAPHLWIKNQGNRVSTIDLFHHEWVLITENKQWKANLAIFKEQTNLNIQCMVIGEDILPDDVLAFRAAYGIEPDGATLVRPDGYIACRWPHWSADQNPSFSETLHRVTFTN